MTAQLATPTARADTYYWDVNGATAGFSTVVGTWGTASAWNSDVTGGAAGSIIINPLATDDLNIVAATTNTGIITVSGAQLANTITYGGTVGAVTISGGTSVTLGNGTAGAGGITVNSGAGAQTISTALILNNSQTWTNNSANTLSLGGGLSLGAGTLTFGGSGRFDFTAGSFGNAGTGGIIMNGTGVLSLRQTTNTNYTGSTTVNSGTILLNAGTKSTGNFILNGGIITDYFQQAGTFSSGLGSGANQIQIFGNSGFGAGNGVSNWTIGTANSSLQWGSTFFNPTSLKFFAPNVDNMGPTIFGVVQFNNGFDLNGGTRTIDVAAATGTDAINNSKSIITGVISNSTGTGVLTKTGGGNLQLNGANTYNGGTNITSGMVRFNAKTAMPNAGTVAVSSGATLGILVDNGTAGWSGGTGNGGIAGLVNSGLGGQAGGTVTFAGASSLFLDVTADTVESNNIGNGGATGLKLVKYGANQLTLSGASNTYTGGTNLGAGTILFSKLTSMPATGTVAVTAGTLAVGLGGPGEWTTGTSGAGTIGGLIAASAVGGQGNPVTYAGAVAVGFDTTNATVAQDYTGNIVNRGTTLGVAKLGPGTLTLSGTNTYTGTTTINGGTLIASSQTSTATTGLVTLGNVAGATFQINSNKTIGNLSGGGTTGGTVALQGNTLMLGDGTAQTYGGNFTGTSAAGIVKQGSAVLTLSNATSIPGTMSINAGTVLFSAGNLSGGTITLNANSAVLNFADAAGGSAGVTGTGGATVSNPIVLGNSVTTTGAGLYTGNNGGKWNFTGGITGAPAAASASQTLLIDTRGGGTTGGDRSTTTISGVIADGNKPLNLSFNIAPQTSSTSANNHPTYVNLTGANTFTGSITAIRGNAGATSWLVIGGERWSDGSNNTPTYGRQGTGRLGDNTAGVYAGNINLGSTAGQIVNLDYFSSANQTWSGVIGGGSNPHGALVKEGTGTLTLTNANLYNSLTTVGGGTLLLGFGTTTSNILPATTPLNMGLGTSYKSDSVAANAAMTIAAGGGGGTLQLGGTAASATQTVASLSTAAGTSSSIVLGANRTLTITSGTVTIGAGSSLNFNTVAGGNNGATVGTSVIVFGAAPTAFTAGFTVTDAGGFGLATVNGSNQVIRSTSTSLLPASGATSATDYLVDNNAGGAAAAGSSTLTVTASQSAKTISVDTTAASGTLTLNSAVVLSNNAWGFGGNTPANTYTITGNASGAGVKPVASGDAVSINNFNTGALTFNSPILANGTNAVAVGGGGTVVLAGVNTFTGALSVNGGTLQIGGAGSLNSGSYAGAIAIGNSSTFQYSSSAAQTLSGVISGVGGVTKDTGTGTLTLSGPNTYTGATNVNAGVVSISNATALGSTSSNTVVATGAEVFTGTASLSVAEPFTISGNGPVAGTDGAIRVGGSATAVTFSGPITLAGNSTLKGDGSTGVTFSGGITLGSNTLTLAVGGSATQTFSTRSITGTGAVVKDTLTGTVNFNAANSYTGSTTIGAGVLNLGHASALGGSSPGVDGTSAISMANGSTLRTSLTNGAMIIYAPITTAGSVTINTPSTANGQQTFNEFVLNGAIGGTGNVTFSNTNNVNQIFTVTLNAQNTYSGTTTLDNTAGIAGQAFIKLGIDNGLPTTTVLNLLGQAGTGTGRGIGLNLFGFNQTLAGLTNTAFTSRVQEIVNSDASAFATLTINGSTNTTYSGNLGRQNTGFSVNASAIPGSTNGNNFGLTKNGTGTFTLTGANTFFGPTKILGGILSLGNASALSQSPVDTQSSVAGNATSGLQTTVTTLTIGGLTGNKNFADVFTTTAGGYGAVTAVTLNNVTTTSYSYSGIIANGAANMTLAKTGSGSQVLSGPNTYSGGTSITGGTLAVNTVVSLTDSGTGTGNVSVIGGTLAGTGQIAPGSGNAVSIGAGAVLAPGDQGIGVLTVNSSGTSATSVLTFTGTGSVLAELGPGLTADKVTITSAGTSDVSFSGTVINFTDLTSGSLTAGTYTLFSADVAGAYTGLTTDVGGNITAGLTIGTGLTAYPGSTLAVSGNDIVLNVVPEPGVASLVALAGVGLLARRRRTAPASRYRHQLALIR